MDDLFWKIHQDLPREGPGSNHSTRRAFHSLPVNFQLSKIADMGCGPGMQTLELARLSQCAILAYDTHKPFLDDLVRRADSEGLRDCIVPIQASMAETGIEPGALDLIWSEGAIYIIGFENGLKNWRSLLKPDGCVAVTELSWIKSNPPDAVSAFWRENYPGMHSVEENLAIAGSVGYQILDHFTLPEEDWLENYYGPVEKRINKLRAVYAGNEAVQSYLSMEAYEIDLYRQFSAWYGYEFYVLQKQN